MTTTAVHRFRAVELAAVGDWNAATGDGTITRADLAAIVRAGRDRRAGRAPIKIGHRDTRFAGAQLGWVDDLRLSPDGRVLLGDMVDVPAAFAGYMQTAYPRRSVEILRDPAGAHPVQLVALALLGATEPAVKGLRPVPAAFAQGQAASEPVICFAAPAPTWTAEKVITFTMTTPAPPAPPAAPVSPVWRPPAAVTAMSAAPTQAASVPAVAPTPTTVPTTSLSDLLAGVPPRDLPVRPAYRIPPPTSTTQPATAVPYHGLSDLLDQLRRP